MRTKKFVYRLVGSLSYFEISFHTVVQAYRLLFRSLPLPLFLRPFPSVLWLIPRPPPSSPHYGSCAQYLYISRRGAVSLVAAVVALEYSCLASQHNSEIREQSTVPLNGKISPHRLLYRMHSLSCFHLILSPRPAPLSFPSSPLSSSFRSPLLKKILPLSVLLFLYSPLWKPLNFYFPPTNPFYLFSALFLSCACFETHQNQDMGLWGCRGFLYNIIKNSHIACTYYEGRRWKKKREEIRGWLGGVGTATTNPK